MRDPTVLSLGKRLWGGGLDHFHCTKTHLYSMLTSEDKPRDLAWAVRYDEFFFVMRLKEVTKDGVAVFFFDPLDRGGCSQYVVDCWGSIYPMNGFTVDNGRGWLKTMMQEQFGLRIRRPVIEAPHYIDDVSVELALASPIFDHTRWRVLARVYKLYVIPEDGGRPLMAVYLHFDPNEGTYVQFQDETNRWVKNPELLRIVRMIPKRTVNVTNMWRMTVMYYAVRMHLPIERWIPNPATFHFGETMPIKRWNPFRYIGTELCANIARFLDCCDASGVLLEEYR